MRQTRARRFEWTVAFALLLLGAPARADAPRPEMDIVVLPAEGGASLSVTVSFAPGELPATGDVPYTTERYGMTVPTAATELRESDLFGSGLALDLDGDGRTAGVFPFRCEADGTARLGRLALRPLGLAPMVYRGPDGASPVRRMARKGASVLVYGPCSGERVSLGLSMPGAPIPTEAVPGPLLQVLVLEAAPGPETPPRLQVLGAQVNGGAIEEPIVYESHVYERLGTERPGWFTVTWLMLPLAADQPTQRASVQVATEGAPLLRLVLTTFNYRAGDATRVRVGPEAQRWDPLGR